MTTPQSDCGEEFKKWIVPLLVQPEGDYIYVSPMLVEDFIEKIEAQAERRGIERCIAVIESLYGENPKCEIPRDFHIGQPPMGPNFEFHIGETKSMDKQIIDTLRSLLKS